MSRNYRSIAEPKTLNGDVSNSATQITLNNVTGLPSPPYVLVINPDTASEEAVLVTTNQDGVTAPTLKVERAIETGATAKTHTNTNVVRHMIVGSDLQLVHDHLDNTTTAHGATGAVVGTTNTQTLTNKTLTTPKINENVTLTATSTELNVLDGITASTTELNYTDGVTSAIQTQIDTKAPSAGPTFTGTVVLPSTTSIGTVSATELGYVDGVTSAIQTQLNTLTSSISSIVTVPTGVISPYAGLDSNIPTGYLLCNGQAVSRTTYATLFGVVNTTYGVGDNSTTFNLPDLRGRAPIGAGTGTGLTARALGATVGTETHTLTIAQMPSHDHSSLQFGSSGGAAGLRADAIVTTDTRTGFTGGGEAHPNMQPSLALNFIIKF
jgi:microcystin-dependent protein